MSDEGINPKDLIGATKAPLRFTPQIGIVYEGAVNAIGAIKYGPFNWRDYPITLPIYLEAMKRHIAAIEEGEWIDPDHGLPHAAAIKAGCGIILDAHEYGTLRMDTCAPREKSSRLSLVMDTCAQIVKKFAEGRKK